PTLSLTATGRAGERILSTPAGLSVPVGTTASAPFAPGTRITLGVTNGRAAIWSGVCSSAGNKTPTCTFTLNANASETANVQQAPRRPAAHRPARTQRGPSLEA